ncbi:lysylphosphatidylglycerol synthase transmembrane domain-containing protein [Spirosoma validum]|uniref:Flippase-like domain-containing protein n=1 Tax=Spirosoma validum TaxID=2771355 RepID=A0A927B370_9BACT|nr:lysylphosphatidylglycerol synthase transmembrane domain-containing protein [Spirosoma validum]MBD2754761.1 flippase-like domain-containing protein [Spirosoma validum]
MNKRLVRQGLPILLAIGLLWYVLKEVPFATLVAQFGQANYWWLAVAGLIIGIYHISRSARWQLTLQALGYHPALFHTTVALLAGTLASMIIPGAGELTRCGTLQRTDGIPIAKGIGSVVAERVIDLIMLGALVGLTFLLEFKRVGSYLISILSPLWIRITANENAGFFFLCTLVIVGLLTGVVYWLLWRTTLRQHAFILRLSAISRDIGKGFMGIRQLKRPGLFIVLTLLSYGLAFLTTYVLFFATSQTLTLPPTAALTILTVSSLGGLAVPTQGGLGTYHFLVSRVLMLYGLPETESVVVATFLHAVGFGINLVLSSLSFLVVPMLTPTQRPASSTSIVK